MAAFDEAFRSRIHVSIYYPPLKREPTDKIWAMNIKKLSQMNVDYDENEIKKFANEFWEGNEKKEGRRWNGRQIKNAFQTALALASWDFHDNPNRQGHLKRPRITTEHFQMVKLASEHFDEYINDVYGGDIATGGTYAEQAKDGLYRKDNAAPLDLSEAQWAKDNAAPDSDPHNTPTLSRTTSGAQGGPNASSVENMQPTIDWQQMQKMMQQMMQMQMQQQAKT